ncbi:MAG: hypothetical protein M3O66_06085 [Verrucomicrobiota bacterium]|nr:hypothetical protein [Verrucomicrobiota bacterium]
MLRGALACLEIALLSAIILATRCANYHDVFVRGDVYFTDADCYSRMTRVRMCLEHPGLIIRHHSFENFPVGTTPHTTAPFDYLIVAIAGALKPLTPHAIDLAGAIVSPVLGLMAGWFLWWWARRSAIRYRGALLLLFAASPILVHGTQLGRPDHQSLLIFLLLIAICSEWTLQTVPSQRWAALNGLAWALALWVSLYEPVLLFSIVIISHAICARQNFTARHRRFGWALLGLTVAVGFLIERRVPVWSIPGADPLFENWARTIGELNHVRISDEVWLRWCGLLLIPAPALLWIAFRKRFTLPFFLVVLLVATFVLTIWQARWAYFFVGIFAVTLPALLAVIENRVIAWIAISFSMWPLLRDWDEKLWPNESQIALRLERRLEAVAWRDAAKPLTAETEMSFLAPWWWSPAVAYWSGQPGVAGSSHEAFFGIADSARFFLAWDPETAHRILVTHRVSWVLVYDADRLTSNSAVVLGLSPPAHPLCLILDRTPAQAPPFLKPALQNSSCKVFRVENRSEKDDFSPE